MKREIRVPKNIKETKSKNYAFAYICKFHNTAKMGDDL